MLILNRRDLYRIVQEYVKYYNHSRPHQGIGQQIPECLAENNPWPTRKPWGKKNQSQSWVGATTATRELPSGSTDAALKTIAEGHQGIVDGLFVLGWGSETSAFVVFCGLFLDSILCWLANLGIGWHDGENDPKGIPSPDGQAKSPTPLGEFLCRQLVLLLFLFLFDLLLFLLVSLVFILLTAFFSHRMSPFWRTTWLGRGRQPCAAPHKGIIAVLALHWNDLKLYSK